MKLKIIAHRGASGKAPENTLASIRLALSLSVDFIEIDVRLSKELIPVVIHDLSVQRVTNRSHSAEIHSLSVDEIEQLDVGTWFSPEFKGEKIPLLADLFNFSWNKTGLMLEIKETREEDKVIVDEIFKVLEKGKHLPEELIIGSFSPSIIAEAQKRSLDSSLKVNFIGILEDLQFIDRFRQLGLTHLAIWRHILSTPLLKGLKEQGMEVWSFTINDADNALALSSMGVDGVISNHPEILIES